MMKSNNPPKFTREELTKMYFDSLDGYLQIFDDAETVGRLFYSPEPVDYFFWKNQRLAAKYQGKRPMLYGGILLT